MSFAQERSTWECNTDMMKMILSSVYPYPQPSVKRICWTLLPNAVAHRHGTAGWGLDIGAFASCCLSGRLLQTKQNIVKGLHHYFVLIYSIFLVIPNNMSCLLQCWLMSLGIQLPLITKEKQALKLFVRTVGRRQTTEQSDWMDLIMSYLKCVCG